MKRNNPPQASESSSLLSVPFPRVSRDLPGRSVRKDEDAKRLQIECGDSFSVLKFDVTDEEAVQKAAAKVAICMHGHCLLGLVNNAGQCSKSELASWSA